MVSGNKKRNVKYGHIQIRSEALKEFKSNVKPGETYTDAILRLIKTFNENNRKRPEESGHINKPIAETQ